MTVEDKRSTLFRSWWDSDFSWDGLRHRIAIINGKEIDLQTIFSCFKDDLVEFDGRRWTPLHIPWERPDALPGRPPNYKTTAITQYAANFLSSFLSSDLCLSGVITDGSFVAPRTSRLRITADQAMISGTVALGKASYLRLIRSWVGGNVRGYDLTIDDDIVLYGNAIVGSLTMTGCQFGKFFDFRSNEVSGEVILDNSKFLGYAASFDNSKMDMAVSLNQSEIHGDLRFYDSVFGSDLMIIGAAITGDFILTGSSVSGKIVARDLSLYGNLYALGASAELGIDISKGKVTGKVLARGSSDCALGGILAREAVFKSDVDFSGRAFTQRMDFSRAEFAVPPFVHSAKLYGDITFSECIFKESIENLHSDQFMSRSRLIKIACRLKLMRRMFLSEEDIALYNLLCEQRSNSYRTLRLACAEIKNVEYESLFYVLELRARRKRTDIPAVEKIVSLLYDFTSACGTSLTRCLLILCFIPILGSASIAIINTGLSYPSGLRIIMQFCIRQMGPPPSVWTAQDLAMTGEPIASLLKTYPSALFAIGTSIFVSTFSMAGLVAIVLQRRFRQ